MHKYHVGEEVNIQVDEYGNWGNGGWVSGKVIACIFINGKLGYDIQDNQGYVIHNVSEEFTAI